MTEKVIIFIIVGGVIVAVTLIAAVMQIIKSVCEAKVTEYNAITISMLREMGGYDGETEEQPLQS